MNKLARINVILPVYNPPCGWYDLALTSCYYIRESAPLFDWQFHFVNDGSPSPKVFDALRERSIRFIHLHEYDQNKGKGFAIRYGLQQAGRANIYIHSDWDFPFGEQLLIDAIKKLQFADIILANRGSDYMQHLPYFRQFISFSQRLFNSYVLFLTEMDTQAGFKAFSNKGYAVFMETQINEFLFDTEFIAMAQKIGLKMQSIPVTCRPNLVFKNFSPKVLSKELNHISKILEARYVKKYSFTPDYRLRRV